VASAYNRFVACCCCPVCLTSCPRFWWMKHFRCLIKVLFPPHHARSDHARSDISKCDVDQLPLSISLWQDTY